MKQQSFGENPETGFFVGGCKKEHKLCPYGPDQSWRWWPPIMRRFAPTHLLLSSPQSHHSQKASALSSFYFLSFSFFPSFLLTLPSSFFFSLAFVFAFLFFVPAFANNLTPSFIITLFSFNLGSGGKELRNRNTLNTKNEWKNWAKSAGFSQPLKYKPCWLIKFTCVSGECVVLVQEKMGCAHLLTGLMVFRFVLGFARDYYGGRQ